MRAAQRFGMVYRAVALMALNTLLLLLLVECAAGLALAGRGSALAAQIADFKAEMLRLNYYYAQDWAAAYWDEHMQAVDHYTYQPYTLWRSRPFAGQFINVDDSGRRVTPGAVCAEGKQRIYAFGGSTLWGYGAPDWGTIPAYLQAGLDAERVCVLNYAEVAYNSTQSLARLLRLLAAGDVPDVVIFYGGANDVTTAARSGQPAAPFYVERLRPAVEAALNVSTEAAPDGLSVLLRGTAVYRLLVGSRQPEATWMLPPFAPEFVDGVTNTFLANARAGQALAAEYGFVFIAFLQPVLVLSTDEPDPETQRFLWEMPGGLPDLFREVYPRWQAAAATSPYLHDLTNVLDGQPVPVWIDFNHLSPWGNLAVADAMLKVIRPIIGG
jgi:lysophospholipase L1-like esterase